MLELEVTGVSPICNSSCFQGSIIYFNGPRCSAGSYYASDVGRRCNCDQLLIQCGTFRDSSGFLLYVLAVAGSGRHIMPITVTPVFITARGWVTLSIDDSGWRIQYIHQQHHSFTLGPLYHHFKAVGMPTWVQQTCDRLCLVASCQEAPQNSVDTVQVLVLNHCRSNVSKLKKAEVFL